MVALKVAFVATFCVCVSSSLLATKTISFDEYHKNFRRSYRPDSEEYGVRQALFEERAKEISTQNAMPGARWAATFNEFTDRTEQELKLLRGRRGPRGSQRSPALGLLDLKPSLDESVDWSYLKSINPPKDQGGCGSCWAFATAAMLNAHTEIHLNQTVAYSPQQLVDCTPNPHDCGGEGGCRGATVELAMQYVMDLGGLDTFSFLSDTPYTGHDGTCSDTHSVSSSLSLSAGVEERSVQHHDDGRGAGKMGLITWSTLPSNQALPLMQALADGPVALSVAAGRWFGYSNGVFDSCTNSVSDQASLVIDHATVLVGYGKMDINGEPTNYWRILNSWGPSWGDNGFINILRHDTPSADDEFCGTDLKPEDGIACKDPITDKYPDKDTVCGMCGLLFDSVAPKYGRTFSATQRTHALRGTWP